MLATILLATAASVPAFQAEVEVVVDVPSIYVQGQPFRVEVTYSTGAGGGEIEAWQATPAAVALNGQPLAERSTGLPALQLPPDGRLSWTGDLSAMIDARGIGGEFTLAVGEQSFAVQAFDPAPAGLDFMAMADADLAKYMVLMRTNQGDMLLEFFPDLAPGHVHNFLDLCYTGFYEGTLFHRVSSSFMIQGGCPNTRTDNKNSWGGGNGPRTLEAEFSDRKHARGILSMARGPSPNSGSCQFFVMTQDSSFLDNKYSVFGRMLAGDKTLEAISNAEGRQNRDGTTRPSEPQRIEQTVVLEKSGA